VVHAIRTWRLLAKTAETKTLPMAYTFIPTILLLT